MPAKTDPILARRTHSPAPVLLQVGARLRGPLASALLARGMQPVLGHSGQRGLTLEIREFGPPGHGDMTALPRPPSSAPPLLALLPGEARRDDVDWRMQALQADALSLIGLDGTAADIDAIAQVAARLTHWTRQPERRAPAAAAQEPDDTDLPYPPIHAEHSQPDASTPKPTPELIAALDEAVAHARQIGAMGALLLIGLNRLAEIDTALGPAIRRDMVDTIEARLTDVLRLEADRHRLRPAAELYRWDGGFAIVWPQFTHAEDARLLAQRLLKQASEPLAVAGEEASFSANAGISLLPHDGIEATTLLEAAERALHQARGRGPGQCQFHEQGIAPRQRERLRLEARLRRAVADGGFELYYQPQVDLQTGALTGAEALLRWPDGTGGMVPTNVFIPIAEANGLIVPLGHWVLQRVCRQIRRWLDNGLEVPRIAINVSPQELLQPDFVVRVLRSLADAGLSGRHLCIELTEAALMTDTPAARAATATLRTRLLMLREAGVQLSIDDFGTGCSSLSMLRRLPVDGLKIDHSFVADFDGDGAAICSAIIGLAHTLGLRVVAEGIETDAQLAFLRQQGCDEFQGHVLSRALDATIMGEVLAGASVQYRVSPAPTLPTALQSAPLPVSGQAAADFNRAR
jgi:EAL domain-containing protein (putative c-di-GMP-specific phosphodiesterase class I)/GGDEF domain-containing protein